MSTRGTYCRRRGDPWRWPASIALSLGFFLVGALLTPDSWLEYIFSTGRPIVGGEDSQSRPWLVLQPPLAIEAVPQRKVPAPTTPPPVVAPPVDDWWRDGWRIRVAEATEEVLRPTPADSAAFLLNALGLPRDLLARARPDSVLKARLLLMAREDSFRFDELKPYFGAVTRARAHADIRSRAADMYDDHLASEIMVPD